MRRTKIVCTLGPASSDLETIRSLVAAGMDVARLNFSHGTQEDHGRRIALVRQAAKELGRDVTILQDLQGPKIRIGDVRDGCVIVQAGDEILLTSEELPLSDDRRLYVSYPALEADVEPGGRVLIDDGLIELEIRDVREGDVVAEVVVGGELKSRKGVHLPLMRNTKPSLTEKDISDLEYGLRHEVDVVALSFVRRAADIEDLLGHIRAHDKEVSIVSKIEKPEAVAALDEILEVSDGIMVARGDLGIEMPLSQVPGTQKMIIRRCLQNAKPVITATQMLESMIENPRPTRAEASDVANAVLDGSDAVMLSGETAAGRYPVRVVEVMSRIVNEAERLYQLNTANWDHGSRTEGSDIITDSVAITAVRMAERVGARAVVCLTASGTTARTIARHRPAVPVYAFTDDDRVVRRLGLVWGTKGFAIPFQHDTDHGVRAVHEVLRREKLVEEGDTIVITAGMPLPAKGRTNMVHVSRI